LVKGTNIIAHLHDQRFRQKLGRSSSKFFNKVFGAGLQDQRTLTPVFYGKL
jgi:hypothetical protein